MADVADHRFKRGQLFHSTGAAVASADQGGQEFEGMIAHFADIDPTTKSFRSRGDTVCIWVRNVSGQALLPGSLAVWQSTYIGKRINGATCTTGQKLLVAGVVDEWLPAGGCPTGDCCWIAVKGPTRIKTPDSENASAAFDAGTYMVAFTGAASTGTLTESGRVVAIDAVASSTNDITYATQISPIGRALTTMTSSQTSTNALIHVDLL